MKKKWKYILMVMIIFIVGYSWYKKTTQTKLAIQYKTTLAAKGSLVTSVSGSGNVVVDQLATVDPTISGTVENLAVKVGDSVKKGQILFTLNNDALGVSSDQSTASYIQAQNSFASAQLNVKQARADYAAAKKSSSTVSYDQKKILKDKIVIAEAGVIAAQASLVASQANLRNQQTIAGQRTVKAPISGTVSAINVKNGDALGKSSSSSASSSPIVIGDLNTLKANVSVNEVDISNVSIGQKVMMTFGAIDELSITGKVEKMDALGTLTQGVVSYSVTIGFDSIDSRIRPQMSVSAKIITDVKQDVITVSNSALKTQGNSTYIEVLEADSQVPNRRMIEIGSANNLDTEIVSGINVGDNVVVQTIDPNVKTTKTTTGSGGVRFPGLSGGRG